MITQIVFVLQYPFGQRDYQRWGIEMLQQNGFDVAVWDFTPVLYPHGYQETDFADHLQYAGLRLFLTQTEALTAIAHLPSTSFVLCLAGYQMASFPVYRALSRRGVKYAVAHMNAIPPFTVALRQSDALRRLASLTPAKLASYLFRRVPFQALGVRAATAALAGGARSLQPQYPMDKSTEIIWAHTLDYDLYLQAQARPVQVNARQGVFMDNYLPFHPEYVFDQSEPPFTAETYYPPLCRFFDQLEQTYGVRIVIAAHPRSHYEDHPDYFGGRPVCRDQTLQLVQESGFVLAHASTALNFAVLFRKPTLFLTTHAIERDPVVGSMIRVMAGWFNKTPIYIDQQPLELDWERELTVDEPAYAAYREAYIKRSGSPDKPCWQIFADFVKSLD